MSRIERIQTKQGHPVPKTAGYARGPFPPELYENPPVITEYAPEIEELPLGATAQNNFKAIKWFRCKHCSLVVSEHQVQSHHCEEMDVQS